MNPEFQRNIWLSWSNHRAFFMSVFLGAVFLLTLMTAKVASAKASMLAVSSTAIFGFVILTMFWATNLVSRSLITEIHERTWDFQRMSSIGPWQMVWGKIFGSSVMAWFGGGICLAVYMMANVSIGELPLFWTGIWLGFALLSQTFALLVALLVLQAGGELKVKRSSGVLLVFFVLILLGFVQASSRVQVAPGQIGWHTWNIPIRAFALGSLFLFVAWAMVGSYRIMRKQLQFQNAPWVWLGFTLFMMVYVSGFLKGDYLAMAPGLLGNSVHLSIAGFGRLVIAFEVGIFLTFVMAFVEPKNPVDFRLLFDSISSANVKGILHTIPRWFLSLATSFLILVLIVVFPLSKKAGFEGPLKWILLGQGAFLVRDIGVILLLSFSERIKRTDTIAFLYLALLYGVIPNIILASGISAGGSRVFLSFFWPFWCYESFNILFPVVEAVLVLAMCISRWKETFSAEKLSKT